MKKVMLFCALIITVGAGTSFAEVIAWNTINTGINGRVGTGESDPGNYQGSSGSTYQYDLNNGSDRNSYSIDLDAQRRDLMHIGVGRSQDRLRGQNGGGIR